MLLLNILILLFGLKQNLIHACSHIRLEYELKKMRIHIILYLKINLITFNSIVSCKH